MRRSWSVGVRAIGAAAGVTVAAVLLAQPAAAHAGEPLSPHDLAGAWEFAPPVVGMLLALSLCYGLAVTNLWRAAGRGRLVAPWQAATFALGIAALAAALLSPLDAFGGALFSAHMAQHVLLMMVAAPLLALGAPAYLWLWVLPLRARRNLAHWWLSRRYLGQIAHLLGLPLTIWLVSTAALWLWHVSRLYEAALADDLVHALEHGTFLATAWLFWGVVLALVRPVKKGDGIAILMVFAAAMQSGILGALITFARVPWYPAYAATTAAWGLTPLEDQQLAGVIMWVPAGTVYLAATLAILGRRLAALDRQAAPRAQEYAPEYRQVRSLFPNDERR